MHRHTLTWFAIFGVIALMFLQLPQMAARHDSVLHVYSGLVEVDALARQQFVEPVVSARLVDGAIRGLLLQLDPYSGYIAPDELPTFLRRNEGEFIGIGIEVGVRDAKLTVIAPVEGSPAAKAGILAGDVILAINGRQTEGLSAFDVEELLGGTPGTTVQLRVQHSGRSEPETLTITRGPVSVVTVRGFRREAHGGWDYLIDPLNRLGYIRVTSFHNNTMRDFDAALTRLREQGVVGLIIDLRFNPGGVMLQAIAMVDCFVDDGVILSTVTRRRAVQRYLATPGDTVQDIPLAVLINRGSASSSEIVAGSLQAHGRAIVVGERSFGKGSVQHLVFLEEGRAAIKLTTAYYRMPDDRIIHRTPANEALGSWGILPDIVVSLSDEEEQEIQEVRRAADLAFTEVTTASGSAPCGGPSSLSPDARHADSATAAAPKSTTMPEIVRDRQLLEALTHLRERSSAAHAAQ